MKSNKSNGQLTAQINLGNNQKSGFDLSNNVLGTGKIGRIIPTRALHVMPGDTIKADSKVAVQFEPLAVPILANMDVKQEHFYCPYNVVWKNWDKFISGGEKMDYKGVVPNVSMYKMLQVVSQKFLMDQMRIIYRGQYESLDDNVFLSLDYDGTIYSNMLQQLDYIGDMFQIRDLLQPQYDVLEKLHTLNIGTNNFKYPFTFVEYDRQGTSDDLIHRQADIDSYIYEFVGTGNKYIEEIKPYLVDMLSYNSLVLPTDKGFAELELLYQFIKPLVGLGSNIDYLNMGRLTLSEFLVLVINDVNMLLLNYQGSFTANTSIGNLLFYQSASNLPLSVLNLRANYNIWYNNYRDILLESGAFEPYDGDDVSNDELFVLLVPRQRCWEKDAFTTALDNPGTGTVGVPITRDPQTVLGTNLLGQDSVAQLAENDDMQVTEVEFNGQSWRVPSAFLSGQNPIDKDTGNQYPGFSLHALDAAQRAQKWLQKALFFGNRISDFYYLRFGVRFLDARLRLPELLTSSSELVKLDVIVNNTNITTEAEGEVFRAVAGDRAAYASAYDNGNSFDRFCEEHGVIMSYLTIMPQITYAYGINRDYSRIDQFDFAFSEFATLGMDAVYDTEITAFSIARNGDGTPAQAQVFGYQGRYYDYKAKHSEEHGELLDSQDMYTFARKFNMFAHDGRPKLNYEFVHCFPSLDMFVVDSPLADYFRYDIRHSTAAERQLPSQSIYI